MADWAPILVLPNLDNRGTIDCDIAALVSVADSRVELLRSRQPRFHAFLSQFQDQFRRKVRPAVILLKSDAPRSYYTAEAVQGFRDLCALSVVPYARAERLLYGRESPFIFSNIFVFYPWMTDKNLEYMVCINPAMFNTHLVEEFRGQSFPEQGVATLTEAALDLPLIKKLLVRWEDRFADKEPDWESLALFRSLNMANQAAQIPAMTAASIYDDGRSIALWVSALEILARPESGKASYDVVSRLLARAPWLCSQFSDAAYPVTHQGKTNPEVLTSWLYHRIYKLRNDFLHGNKIEPNNMVFSAKDLPAIDFAACLYRSALAAKLDLKYLDKDPENTEKSYVTYRASERRRFDDYQRKFEWALLTGRP